MILADKIIDLRKKNGLSQEELAEKLGVSRQAVSKWEGALSTPDMKKIIAMSELFGVSTDYLLKDSISLPEEAPVQDPADGADSDEKLRPVDMETANSFLTNNEKNAVLVSLGVMLCIFSPIALILLSVAGETGALPISEEQGTMIGLSVLILLVAAAVGIFVTRGIRSQRFEYLKNEALDTAYGVDGMIKERREKYEKTHVRNMTIGILLCVASSVPLLITGAMGKKNDFLQTAGVAVLLVFIGVGVFFIVRSATIWSGFQVLLEEGDYTRGIKRANRHIGSIYWGIVTAIYLVISLATMRWDITWIVWPVAGAVYGVVRQVYLRG